MRLSAIGFVPLLRDGARRFAAVIPPVVTLAILLAGCGGGGDGGHDGGVVFNDAGTIAFGVHPDWEGGIEGDQGLVTLGDEGSSQLRVLKDGHSLRLVMFSPEDGVERDISVDVSHWAPGVVHSVTATWGDGQLTLYTDGVKVGTSSYAGSLEIPPGTPLFLGSDPGAPDGALIEGFEHFGRALDDSEIDIHAED